MYNNPPMKPQIIGDEIMEGCYISEVGRAFSCPDFCSGISGYFFFLDMGLPLHWMERDTWISAGTKSIQTTIGRARLRKQTGAPMPERVVAAAPTREDVELLVDVDELVLLPLEVLLEQACLTQ